MFNIIKDIFNHNTMDGGTKQIKNKKNRKLTITNKNIKFNKNNTKINRNNITSNNITRNNITRNNNKSSKNSKRASLNKDNKKLTIKRIRI